ncbi:MAG: L,D-transpeptidase [Ectothiorhodospiraceae bacterium]|nr:L,D-transpeptidase [Ectothiorhodospiraceae bacterium]MCH8503672.1 L,D-transpeptidase [Ectothiorhodospiraceae bacterium]
MVSAHSTPAGPWLHVDVGAQQVRLMHGDEPRQSWPASTAAAGLGEQNGSLQTPRGWHYVRAKIGQGMPAGAVFRGRRWTGEICDASLYAQSPDRDWILSRILWLCGLEPGLNRLGNVDTMRRYIYLHGCPDPVPLGEPLSKGCVRMRNDDIVALYDRVPPGTRVLIR